MTSTALEFARATGARFLLGSPLAAFDGVSIDTRTLQAGNLFFAIPGPRHDGHDHLTTALDKSAAGLVLQRLDAGWNFDRRNPPLVFQAADSSQALQRWAAFLRKRSTATVIGITGTNGKTSTKEMISAILTRVGPTLSTQGNLNNQLGLPLTLARLTAEQRFMVLELGISRPGDMQLLAGIAAPQIGVITNIGKAHLQGLRTAEGVRDEKRILLDRLPVDGTAVINQDDPLLAGFASSLQAKKVFFGLSALADVRAESIEDLDGGVRFVLNIRGKRETIRMQIPGRFQVFNALAAAAAAHAAGASLSEIVAGLAAFRPVAMRMQSLPHPSGALLINDAYNANPNSVRAAVSSFCQSYRQRPRWLVLGDMRELGAGAAQEHRDLGVWLTSQPLERVYLYGRDTRFVLEGLAKRPASMQVSRFRKKRQLLAELQTEIVRQPVILFKGSRSMKLEQLINPLTAQPAGAAH
jgi:UDP-N-acetylmuramoyl-tripeptide--D-alanyl-D-alanine ligase